MTIWPVSMASRPRPFLTFFLQLLQTGQRWVAGVHEPGGGVVVGFHHPDAVYCQRGGGHFAQPAQQVIDLEVSGGHRGQFADGPGQFFHAHQGSVLIGARTASGLFALNPTTALARAERVQPQVAHTA